MFSPTKMTRKRKEAKDGKGNTLSISQLAVRLGSDRSLVSSWENDRRTPTLINVVKLADALGCSVDDLVLRGDELKAELSRQRLADQEPGEAA